MYLYLIFYIKVKVNIYLFILIIIYCLIFNISNSYAQESYRNKSMIIIVNGQDLNIMRNIYNHYHTEIIKLQRFKVLAEPDEEIKFLLLNNDSKGLDTKAIFKIKKYSSNGYVNIINYNYNMTYQEPKKKGDKFNYIFNINAFSKYFDIEKQIFINSASISASGQAESYEKAVNYAISNLVNELILTTREVFSFKTSVLKRDFWGGKVILNLGSNHGIKEGLSFKVYDKK
ncbi:MAG: hypothetical protein KatS3mg068_0503 [Candidatus Sericytochromatia bacterium]|nr:MAG: hypothetical protein KatS3mg068_0503 [Candidatus Sericytochromatia bacterium]